MRRNGEDRNAIRAARSRTQKNMMTSAIERIVSDCTVAKPRFTEEENSKPFVVVGRLTEPYSFVMSGDRKTVPSMDSQELAGPPSPRQRNRRR